MADRRAKERRAILLRDGQQRDFAVEADEFLDDQLADIAARPFAAVVPGPLQFAGIPDERLPLARGGHQRLDHAREPDPGGSLLQFGERRGVEITGGLQPQLPGGKVADGLAVHREIDGAGARHDLDALAFEVVEAFGADRLDLGDDDVGAVPGHGGGERIAVEPREHLAGVGHLHGRGACIGIARHDGLSQPLRRDYELLAQFARTEQHDLFSHMSVFFSGTKICFLP